MADGVGSNWVGDLMLEGTVDIKSLTGSVTMELVEATRTLGCSISLDGSGSVARLMNGNKVLAEQRCPITGPGSYEIRFANFDDRLVLWVNDQLVFGNGIALDRLTPEDNGPTKRDLSPARWSFSNVDLTLKHIRLFRDIYYTRVAGPGDEHPVPYALEQTELDQLTYWQKSLATTFQRDWAYTSHPAIPGEGAVYQVPEGHYMACGDNSPRSFDGRGWRLSSFIPIQCLMGKGVVRYWPIEWPFWFPKYVE
jgi:signal peptidase I